MKHDKTLNEAVYQLAEQYPDSRLLKVKCEGVTYVLVINESDRVIDAYWAHGEILEWNLKFYSHMFDRNLDDFCIYDFDDFEWVYQPDGGLLSRYIVECQFYSFCSNTYVCPRKCFKNLLEAWSYFKDLRKSDDDNWQETAFYFSHDDSVIVKPQRPHARSAEEWRRIVWEKEDALQRERLANEGINALFEDVIDIEPIIYDEDEYVFDKDDIKF